MTFLGGLLANPHRLADFRYIPNGAFGDERNIVVWTAMKGLHFCGRTVDVWLLSDQFALAHKLRDRAGGDDYLACLEQAAAPVRRLRRLADILTLIRRLAG